MNAFTLSFFGRNRNPVAAAHAHEDSTGPSGAGAWRPQLGSLFLCVLLRKTDACRRSPCSDLHKKRSRRALSHKLQTETSLLSVCTYRGVTRDGRKRRPPFRRFDGISTAVFPSRCDRPNDRATLQGYAHGI